MGKKNMAAAAGRNFGSLSTEREENWQLSLYREREMEFGFDFLHLKNLQVEICKKKICVSKGTIC
ncbi:hypothetical protein LguiA_024009 [Lonicera macranthoides]